MDPWLVDSRFVHNNTDIGANQFGDPVICIVHTFIIFIFPLILIIIGTSTFTGIRLSTTQLSGILFKIRACGCGSLAIRVAGLIGVGICKCRFIWPVTAWAGHTVMPKMNFHPRLEQPGRRKMRPCSMLHPMERKKLVTTPKAIHTQTFSCDTVQATPATLPDAASHALIVYWRCFIFEQT